MNLPDFAMRCGHWPTKEEVVRARLLALDMLVTCRRCKGTGKYERNPLDDRCYGCSGRGKKLPPLTARLAATVRERVEQGALIPYFEAVRVLVRGADLANQTKESR